VLYVFAKKSANYPQQQNSLSSSFLKTSLCVGVIATGIFIFLAAQDPLFAFDTSIPKNANYSEDSVRFVNRILCIHSLRSRILQTIRPLLRTNQAIALTNLPIHWNLGDNFIWLGEKLVFHSLGRSPIETSSESETNLTLLQTHLWGGTIFVQGGGNFGDIWRHYTVFMLEVIKKFPNNPVIFLPQSMHYWNATIAIEDAKIFNQHSQLLMLMRDMESIEAAKKFFPKVNVKFCPDMAFAIGPLLSNSEPVIDILWLIRTDKESALNPDQLQEAHALLSSAGLVHETWDFPIEPNKSPWNWTAVGADFTITWPNRGDRASAFTQLAVSAFSRARWIITDRLHATILSLLMGKPHIYLDNNYGKIRKLFKATYNSSECSAHNRNSFLAATPKEAAEIAIKMMRPLE